MLWVFQLYILAILKEHMLFFIYLKFTLSLKGNRYFTSPKLLWIELHINLSLQTDIHILRCLMFVSYMYTFVMNVVTQYIYL